MTHPGPAADAALQRAPHAFRAAGATARAPHVRSALDVSAVMHGACLALLPCLAVALYNTGYQANAILSDLDEAPAGWRGAVLGALGARAAPEDALGCWLHGALYVVPLLLAAGLAGGLTEWLFARLRGRAHDPVALPATALVFTLCLPPTLPLWQAAAGLAAGIALGREIFGGLGRNLIHPALAGLALLYFAYPASLTGDEVWIAVDGYSGATPLAAAAEAGLDGLDAEDFAFRDALLGTVPGALGETSTLACVAGLGVLLYAGLAAWRVVAGGLLGLAVGVGAAGLFAASQPLAALPWHWHVVSGGFAFGLVFLATDPVTGAVTNPGRWLFGALIGLVTVLIRVANPAHREGVMLALLLANVTAPLLDQIVARVQRRRWSRRRVG